MKLYLIRHGSIDKENPEKPLSERGIMQAKAVAEELKNYNFEKVYCSNLLRTKQTCEYYTKDYIEDKRLREIQGTLNGKKFEPEYDSKEREEQDRKNADEIFDELIKNKGNIAVFCHGNVIVYYLNKVLKLNQNLWGSLIIKHGSISILEYKDDKLQIKAINLIDYLPNEIIEKVVYKSNKD